MGTKFKVEIAYATSHKQVIISLEVKKNSTIESAILSSGILTLFPDIDLKTQKVGVFSIIKKINDIVKENDRIEIYRTLLIDPKEARRRKARKL